MPFASPSPNPSRWSPCPSPTASDSSSTPPIVSTPSLPPTASPFVATLPSPMSSFPPRITPHSAPTTTSLRRRIKRPSCSKPYRKQTSPPPPATDPHAAFFASKEGGTPSPQSSHTHTQNPSSPHAPVPATEPPAASVWSLVPRRSQHSVPAAPSPLPPRLLSKTA